MSKKHFIAMAKAIATITDNAERERVAKLIGGVCAESNVNFKMSTFLTACNVKN